MREVEINQDVFNYISKNEYIKIYKDLQDGDNKKIYESKELRIRVSKIGNKVFIVKTYFGDKPIEEIYKNVFKVQDMM